MRIESTSSLVKRLRHPRTGPRVPAAARRRAPLIGAVAACGLSCLAAPAFVSAATIASGDLIVVDSEALGGNGGLFQVNPTTGAQTTISPAATLTSRFVEPMGVAVDATGHIFVAEKNAFTGNGGVIEVDPTTGAQTPVTSERAFINPSGIVVEPSGDLLVVDPDGLNGLGAVIRVNRERNEQTVVAYGGAFGNPVGIALEANGQILVVDPDLLNGLGGVVRIDPSTGAQTVIASGGNFGNPSGIAVSPKTQRIFVADPDLNNGAGGVVRIDPVTLARVTIASGGSFGNPSGIVVEATGNLIVVDPDAFSDNNGGLFRVVPGTGQVTILSRGGAFIDPRGAALGRPNPPAVKRPAGQTIYRQVAGSALCSGPIYTVPKGKTKVKFEVIGQPGKEGVDGPNGSGGSGGFAGRVIGEINVVAGQKLYLNVGRNGTGVINWTEAGTRQEGSGGDMTFISSDPNSQIAAADSRSCTTSSFLVIGAGGGGGGDGLSAYGGTGGEADGQGRNGGNYLSFGDNHGNGGLPGTLLAGGLGGRSSGEYIPDGDSGLFQSGGSGADDVSWAVGGDGGGGLYGGGGGGAGTAGGGGGGGGGASYTSLTAVVNSYIGVARTRIGPPMITLTPLK